MSSHIAKVDIFAIPFAFSQSSNKKSNKTVIGGILTIIFFILSLLYFIYLCYLYFGNKIQPTMTFLKKQDDDPFSIDIEPDMISVKLILADGLDLFARQQETGKVFLLLGARHAYYKESGVPEQTDLNMIPCQNQELKGSYCIDLNDYLINNKYQFSYTPQIKVAERFQIMIAKCQKEFLEPGQSCEDINDQIFDIFNITNYLLINIRLKQYNAQTKSFETVNKQEKIFFDSKISTINTLVLQKSQAITNEGFIIQKDQSFDYISDFVMYSQYIQQEQLQKYLHFSILGIVQMQLGSQNETVNIQFAPFTQLLAQFSSVFNSLLFIGFFAKIFSQASIIQEFIDIQLKTYYKKTALELIENKNKSTIKITDDSPISSHNKLMKTEFNKRLKYYFNLDFIKSLKFLKNVKKTNLKIDTAQPKELQALDLLTQEAKKAIDIFQVQKDLLQIKMMLKILLSDDQYAAIQLCGSKLPIKQEQQIQNTNKKQKKNNQSNLNSKEILLTKISKFEQQVQIQQKQEIKSKSSNNNISLKSIEEIKPQQIECQIQSQTHLEILDEIDRNEILFKEKVEQFLQKQQYNTLDQRILQCMIGTDNRKKENMNKEQIH